MNMEHLDASYFERVARGAIDRERQPWEIAADAAEETRRESERDGFDRRLIATMLQKEKDYPCLKREMENRLRSMQSRTRYGTLDALEAGAPRTYRVFLRGCRRAVIRRRLLWMGQLHPGDLVKLRKTYDGKVSASLGDADDWRGRMAP